MSTNTGTTLGHVFDAGRTITRMDASNYVGYCEGMKQDANTRNRQRRAVHRAMHRHMIGWDHPVPPGEYGRITVEADGSVHYCAGQYATTEFYGYVERLVERLAAMWEAA